MVNYFTGGVTYQKSAVLRRGQTATTLQVAVIRIRYCRVVFMGAYIPGTTGSYEYPTMLVCGLKAYSSAHIITVRVLLYEVYRK